MILARLRLFSFRNYERLELDFDPGITAVVGKNASGKTNLVEAIQFLSLARSFRASDTGPLIKEGQSGAAIEASIREGDLLRTIRIELAKDAKRIFLNGKPLRRLSELSRLVNVLFFSPADVPLFAASPSERRDFLDISLSKQSLDYFRLISRYGAALRERNALLKEASPDEALLSVLTSQLIALAEPIVRYRELYIASLNRVLPPLLGRLRGDSSSVELVYRPFLKTGEDFAERAKKAFASAAESDRAHRSTGIGVHREDFSLRLNGRDISAYGSQGENRMAVLALKLCPYYLIEDEERKPICVLDDVTSELDAQKQGNLFEVLKDFRQVFLTTTQIEIEGASYVDVAANNAIRRN